MSLRQQIQQKDEKLLFIEKDKLSRESSLREELISVQQFYKNDCEVSKQMIEEANSAVKGLHEELIEQEETLLKREKGYNDKENHWQIDLQNECEVSQQKIEEVNSAVKKLNEELIIHEETLLRKEIQYNEKKNHWQIDLIKMNNDIAEKDEKIRELYQCIGELQNMMYTNENHQIQKDKANLQQIKQQMKQEEIGESKGQEGTPETKAPSVMQGQA